MCLARDPDVGRKFRRGEGEESWSQRRFQFTPPRERRACAGAGMEFGRRSSSPPQNRGEADRRINERRARHNDELTAAVSRLIPKPGPKSIGFLVWWVLALYALFMAGAPYRPSVEEEQRYAELMNQAVFSEDMRMAEQQLIGAQRALDEVNLWFPSSSQRAMIPERKDRLARARAIFDAESRARNEMISEAKSTVGIWSSYGVDEVRKRFWDAYQSGKDFAKRMTFWDVMFGIGGRRDEEAWVSLMRWLGQIMMNFTVGLGSALFSFCFSLLAMIWEYKTSLASGVAFFVVAMSGATAMVSLFIGGMYGTAVGGVFVLAKQAQNARLEGRAHPQQRRYVRHDQYTHTD